MKINNEIRKLLISNISQTELLDALFTGKFVITDHKQAIIEKCQKSVLLMSENNFSSANIESLQLNGQSLKEKILSACRGCAGVSLNKWLNGGDLIDLITDDAQFMNEFVEIYIDKIPLDDDFTEIDDIENFLYSIWRIQFYDFLAPYRGDAPASLFDEVVCPFSEAAGVDEWVDGVDDFVHATLEMYFQDPENINHKFGMKLVQEYMLDDDYSDAIRELSIEQRTQLDLWLDAAVHRYVKYFSN